MFFGQARHASARIRTVAHLAAAIKCAVALEPLPPEILDTAPTVAPVLLRKQSCSSNMHETSVTSIVAHISHASSFYASPLGKAMTPELMYTSQLGTAKSVVARLKELDGITSEQAIHLNQVFLSVYSF